MRLPVLVFRPLLTTALLLILLAGARLSAVEPVASPSAAPAASATPAPAATPIPAAAPAVPPSVTTPPGPATATSEPSPIGSPAPSPSVTPAATVAAATNPLGATPQEIVKLYGPVLKHNARVRRHEVLEGGTALDGDLHGRNGVVIRVVYHDNHSVLLEYTRVNGALTPADVKTFLDSTANGSVWVQGKDSSEQTKYYRRTDDRAIAQYTAEYDGSLLIAAEGFDHDKLLDNIMH